MMNIKNKATVGYVIGMISMVVLILFLSITILSEGTAETARIHSIEHLREGQETGAEVVPISIYNHSIFTNLDSQNKDSPLIILGISTLSTAVLVLTLIYLLIILINKTKDYSKALMAAVIFLVIRMFSMDLAILLSLFSGVSVDQNLSVIFYGSTLFACFFLVCAGEKIGRKKGDKRVMIVALLYEVVLFIAIHLVIRHPETFYLEQYFRLLMLLPLLVTAVRMRIAATRNAPFTLFAIIGYFTVMGSLLVDTVYISDWIKPDVFWVYPTGLCFFLLAIIVLYYQKDMVARQEEALEIDRMKDALKKKSINLMLSQIQPHFLYNTLQTIEVLCRKDSDAAAKTVRKFSTYLRTNMNFVETEGVVPFEEALKHIQCYTDIEQIRFQERLKMVYDIETITFTIPPLSIQPLVENAIKHGVCKKPEGGTVILRTHEEKNAIVIEVIDDGIGFDVARLEETGTPSKGIKNVTFQLEHMIGATLTITSTLGKGTYQKVEIPIAEDD
ncbi:MAG: histidine kinase [Eubacterium sp.]